MSEVVYFAVYLWAIIIFILRIVLAFCSFFSYQIYGPSHTHHPEFLGNILEILVFIGDTFQICACNCHLYFDFAYGLLLMQFFSFSL